MFQSQLPWVDLFNTLHRYNGPEAYDDVLGPWLLRDTTERSWLRDFRQKTNDNWTAASDEDLCRLYAVFRVTSTLLLHFQYGRKDGTDYLGPVISVEGFQVFHEELGFHVPDVAGYHPFFHEIMSVNQDERACEPVRLDRLVWPALMLGDMMFCRAGCVVTGGTTHVVKEIAEASTLYWTYRRKDRPCNDQSRGWGGNSQWRTRLRRDYQKGDAFFYNIDANESLDGLTSNVDELNVETMTELVRNRCVITAKIDDSDLYPYRYRFTEKRHPPIIRPPSTGRQTPVT
jgi:hypothetical protein